MATRPPPTLPPPRPIRWLLYACLLLSLGTGGHAIQYTRGWWSVRRGQPISEQRLSLLGVPWFKRSFMAYCVRLRRTLPQDARILIEPSEIVEAGGDARWFLFLNYYLYPIQVYVAQPQLASGTLVDYPRWLDHHARAGDFDAMEEEAAAILERGIEWKLTYPVTKRFQAGKLRLFHLEDGDWVPHELARRGANEELPAQSGEPSSEERDP